MIKRSKIIKAAGILLLCSLIAVFVCDSLIKHAAAGKLYTSTDKIPYNNAGLLLGTSKYIHDSYANPYYQYRIDAALALKKAGKIKYIIISGDNSRVDYNEPELMRNDLI